jgi:hypothetical protein
MDAIHRQREQEQQPLRGMTPPLQPRFFATIEGYLVYPPGVEALWCCQPIDDPLPERRPITDYLIRHVASCPLKRRLLRLAEDVQL